MSDPEIKTDPAAAATPAPRAARPAAASKSEDTTARSSNLVSVVVARGTVEVGDHKKSVSHGPGSLIKLPEDEAKVHLASGAVRKPESAA